VRKEFAETLVELAEIDDRIALLTGDLGFTVLEPFAERFPNRFFNVGVAEQNLLGVATGLAEAGFRPYAYSIATFASMRPYEFFRNGAALHRLPVRLVGVGSGFDYGPNGATHYALEDVGIMRLQPEVTVVAPADAEQARAAVRATAKLDRPVYLRLGKDSPVLPGLDGRFELGRAALIGSGEDVAVVTLGSISVEAGRAADLLAEQGVEPTLAVVSSLNPSPEEDLAELLARVPLALTVESHYRTGGLGSFVSELVAERGLPCRVLRCGVAEMPRGRSGSSRWLYGESGLSAEALADTAVRALALAGR
jgi:transketolase